MKDRLVCLPTSLLPPGHSIFLWRHKCLQSGDTASQQTAPTWGLTALWVSIRSKLAPSLCCWWANMWNSLPSDVGLDCKCNHVSKRLVSAWLGKQAGWPLGLRATTEVRQRRCCCHVQLSILLSSYSYFLSLPASGPMSRASPCPSTLLSHPNRNRNLLLGDQIVGFPVRVEQAWGQSTGLWQWEEIHCGRLGACSWGGGGAAGPEISEWCLSVPGGDDSVGPCYKGVCSHRTSETGKHGASRLDISKGRSGERSQSLSGGTDLWVLFIANQDPVLR